MIWRWFFVNCETRWFIWKFIRFRKLIQPGLGCFHILTLIDSSRIIFQGNGEIAVFLPLVFPLWLNSRTWNSPQMIYHHQWLSKIFITLTENLSSSQNDFSNPQMIYLHIQTHDKYFPHRNEHQILNPKSSF